MAERGEVLEAFDGFDEREIAARHHAERAVRKVRLAARPPEIAPDGIQQNAQPPRRAAAGEKNPSAIFYGGQNCRRNFRRPAGLHELAKFFHHVGIRLKQQIERGRNIAFRHLAQIGSDRVRRLGDERAELELAADF